MAITDKFRIDELVKKGDIAIRKDESDKITVRKIDGKQVKPIESAPPKPYGIEPIRGVKVNDVLKSDLNTPNTYLQNPQQETFSGETFVTLERPIYDSTELQKAVDVKVDELIKSKKPEKERYIKYDKYEKKLSDISDLRTQLQAAITERDSLQSIIDGLLSDIQLLNSDLLSVNQQLVESEIRFDELSKKHEQLLQDFQTSIIKGTKEGIERVSLTAQVRGLQAQKETLQKQLQFQEQLVKTLQDTIAVNKKMAEQQINAANQAIEAANQQVKAAQATAATAANSKKKKIICNELYIQGYLPQLLWDADEQWGDKTFITDPKLVIGYQMWARKVVKFMRRKPQYTPIVYFLCKPWTEWMAYDLGVLPKNNLRGQFTHFVGKYFSYMVYDLFGGEQLHKRYSKLLG